EHFAGRWAAKEAIFKCLGATHAAGMSWTEIEIRNDTRGDPKVHVCGAVKELTVERRISDILITIAHCRAYATATALALRGT
ncbi:MAG: holo-ACP synthase, partial [Gemmataceae bacterium]